MQKTIMVKPFMNGGSQAVRIPAECRFDSAEIFLTFDTETGTVTLNRAGSEDSISALLDSFLANPIPGEDHNEFKNLWPKDDFRNRVQA